MIPRLKVVEALTKDQRKTLEDYGFEFLDSGFSAEAWSYKGIVYKFIFADEAKQHIAWFNFVSKHPNKYFPKYKSIGFGWLPTSDWSSFKDKCYCIKSELLIPLIKSEKKLLYEILLVGDRMSPVEVAHWIGKQNSGFAEAVTLVRQGMYKLGFSPIYRDDMDGPNNVMKRPNGTWVILDPWRD